MKEVYIVYRRSIDRAMLLAQTASRSRLVLQWPLLSTVYTCLYVRHAYIPVDETGHIYSSNRGREELIFTSIGA